MGDRNSPYSYEVFRKVPFFGSISNYLRFTQGGEAGRGSGMFQHISNMIGQSWGSQGMNPFGPMGPSGPAPPPGPSAFNIFSLANLLPVGQADAKSTSLFDLVGDETFVRKIKKSNYNEIIKSLEGSAEKFTDQEFPPN